MDRILPRPLLSLVLLIIWLFLNQTLHPAHWLLGGLIAIVVPLFVKDILPPKVRIYKPFALLRLLSWALIEIVRSCFNVSSVIVRNRHKEMNSQFIKIPLDMHDQHGLALLSCLINCTPGTVWVEILPDTHELLLHIFDPHDRAWWVNTIKTRYEKPLMDIFEGDKHASLT